MSGCRCHRGSSRTMLSRRCADDGGGLRLQPPARELRWRGQPVTCWRPARGLRRCAWRRPGIYLAWTFHGPRRARPCRQRQGLMPGGEGPAVPQPEPGHRPPAASPPPPPRGQPRHQPQPPAIFRLTTAGPQLRHTRAAGVSDLDRTTPPAARTVTGPSSLQRPNRYAGRCSRTARSPAERRHPGTDARPGHPGRERAGNPGPLRPPGRRHALPENRPGHQRTRLPRAAPRPGKPPGTAAGHTGMHARPGGPRQARDTPPARPVRGRP